MNHSKDRAINHIVAEDGSEFSVYTVINKPDSDRLAGLYKKYLMLSRKECMDETCSCYKKANHAREKGSSFYLKDGACVTISTNRKTEASSIFPNEDYARWRLSPRLKDVCGAIIVDTNGDEEPNAYAKDIFILRFQDNGLAWDAEVAEGEENEEDDGL